MQDMIIIAGIANQSSPFNVFSCGRAAKRDGAGAQIEKVKDYDAKIAVARFRR